MSLFRTPLVQLRIATALERIATAAERIADRRLPEFQELRVFADVQIRERKTRECYERMQAGDAHDERRVARAVDDAVAREHSAKGAPSGEGR